MKLVHNNKAVPFYLEKEAYEGVRKIAEKVREDFCSVTGIMPEQTEYREGEALQGVFVATLGHSPLLKTLEKEGLLVTSDLAGRYEVYRMAIVERDGKELLVIAGSDKRGTIYGLFALSKAIGVSPWHYWADVVPAHRDEIEISPSRLVTSKEPSVKYRGFFINDEFPSFGNWTIEKFGGIMTQDACTCLSYPELMGLKTMACNSTKVSFYTPGSNGLNIWCGETAKCIDAAVTGYWAED